MCHSYVAISEKKANWLYAVYITLDLTLTSLGRYAGLLGKYRRFGGVSCLHLQDIAV
jgi:hypothetical protein